MAVSYVDGAGVGYDVDFVPSSGPTTTFTIPVPNSGGALVAGDLLIAVVSVDIASTTLTTRTLPSGWTTLTGQQLIGSTTTTAQHEAIYHFVTAGEAGTTPTWVYTPNGATAMEGNVAVSRFRGVDTASPFAIASPFYAGAGVASGTKIAPAVTTTVANAMLVTGFGIRNGSLTLTDVTPSYTIGGNGVLGQGRSVALAHKLQAATGASTTASWNLSATTNPGYAWQSALRPAAADTTAPTVPGSVTATADSSTQVTISWAASTDAVGVASYRVRRGGVDLAGASAVAGTSFVDTSVVASTAYSYTVSAVDSAGNRSAESTAAPVTTPSGTAAPTVGAGTDATIAAGATFSRTATEAANGSTITSRAWTIQSGPAGVGTTIGTAAALSWTPSVAGTYTLRYSATNGIGTGTDDVIVTVTGGTYSYAILGTPDRDSVPVTVKTVGAASVRLKVGTNSTVTTGTFFTSAATPDSSQISKHVISGMAANTQYWYQEEIDGVLGSVRGSFKTDVTAGTAKSFRVAFASCLTSGNATGTAFDNIIANNPELVLHLGDWHYDNDVTTSQSAHVASIENQISANASLKSMVRQFPLAYVWSDHDSGGNDWTGGPATWTPSYNLAYRQVMPVEGTLPTGGIYRSFGRGRVKFILTDGRSYKSPAANTDNASKTMFGTTQEAWIASELADPNYPVKILCVDVPWVYPTTAGDDKWGGYTAAANRLVADIASSGAKVFMIHGDAHNLCADDGSSANNRGALPVAGAAPLGNTTSLKGGPYSAGTYPTTTGSNANQHGLLDITDTGTTITVRFSGRDTTNTERVILSKTFTATTAAVAVKSGASAVNALKVGTAVADKAYVGTSQIWP